MASSAPPTGFPRVGEDVIVDIRGVKTAATVLTVSLESQGHLRVRAWEGNTKYSIPENRFSDTKHKIITKPYTQFKGIELESWHAGCRGILAALESITQDYEHIVIKRLDLLWEDVFDNFNDNICKIFERFIFSKIFFNKFIILFIIFIYFFLF